MKQGIFVAAAFFLASSLICAPLSEGLQGPLGGDPVGAGRDGLQGESLDDVLAMNAEARGGLDKLKAVTTVKMSGKLFIPAQELDLPMELWRKAPDKMRLETAFQDQKMVQGYDGRQAWWIVPFVSAEVREMPGDLAEQFRAQSVFAESLQGFKEEGGTLAGREEMDGTPVFKLALTRPDGRQICHWLDAASGLELKSSLTAREGEADVLVEILYGDYKPVDGLQMPHRIENRVNGKTRARMTMDAIEINPNLSDAIFSGPGKNAEPKAEGRKKKKGS